MQVEEHEDILLEKARTEKNKFEALRLYEQVIKSFIRKKNVVRVRKIYVEIGIYHVFKYFTVMAMEKFEGIFRFYAKIFKDGANFFKQTGNKAEKLECEAIALLIITLFKEYNVESKNELIKILGIFNILNEIHSKESNHDIMARISLSTGLTIFMLMVFCKNPIELEKISQKAISVVSNSWKLSRNSGNLQTLILSIFLEVILLLVQNTFKNYQDKGRKQNHQTLLSKAEEILKLAENCNDAYILSYLYNAIGIVKSEFAIHYIEDEIKQRNFIEKGINFIEKGLIFAKEAKNKVLVITSLFFLHRYAFISGRFMYLQKRIINDLKEVKSAGIRFLSLSRPHFFADFYAHYIPAFYYSNIAQMSFFTSSQRKSYAKKGIDYALKSLKIITLEPDYSVSFIALTVSYAVLVRLATSEEEKRINIEKMLKYAEKADKLGEKYGGGDARTLGYSALYRAYKTLADIGESEEEKINMLSKAIEVSKKNLMLFSESRTGIIVAQTRLGLLYEEIGILTNDIDTLMKAKDLILKSNKESNERGYHYYTATTYEYISRIEDRLGNHTSSAENYKKATESHKDSLRNIKYKLLKDRIKEKINYANAWSKIEMAKAYHKNENHLKAMQGYEEASEILKKIPKYVFEGFYNVAWALLEKAELLSKQEKQDEAINQYKIASSAFEKAIDFLDQASTKSKDQPERERIKKLKKVANVRINYCRARINIEEAILLGKKGEHSIAAEKFAIAASVFRGVCTQYKLERERKELEAIYYLCRAWESMELAEKFEEPERFEYSANLFSKASNLFSDTKLKLLALGNSAFCQALELGCKFDELFEIKIKTELYPKIKLMLSKAASSYGKGGFENVANWALATSIYFDAAWHLIQADKEFDLSEKGRLLNIGSNYLRSAMELFNQADYKNKAAEVQDRLNRVEKEESILFSALNIIKEPSISRSTIGIVAPSCPIESSQSPRLGEAHQFIEEERRIAKGRMERKKYELVYRDLFEEYPKVQKRECRVGIAQIGVSVTGDIMGELYEINPSGLLNIKENKVEEVRSNVKNMVERAHDEAINILLFPEMTIDLNNGKLLELISNQAKLFGMYIIPGSFHDQETKRNISKVFGPDGILWEQEKHIPAVINIGGGKHFKEGIEVGNLPRKTIICNTEYGRIAIVICRDFLDMDLRVELKNFEPPIDIILNPAFTPVTADFKAAHFDARRSIYAYSFFANIGEYGESLIYTPEKDRTERNIPAKEESLIFKDIDLFKLRSERKKWEKKDSRKQTFIQSTR